ncbi:MAG: transporter substrate-binding domain-containing protein [Clostridia bacterium]|nr:transporter substrate-binding domain-containing protein [Clostridia bacterium]
MIALILAALAVVMCFAFAACGGEKATNGNADDTTAADTAASDLAYIKEKGKLVVGMTVYEPMNYKDADGNWTGFDTEFAEAVAEKLGVEVEFIVIDWDNKFFELEAKEIDCIWNGMTITDEALKNASVSDAYVKNAQVVVMKNDKLDSYADAASLAELKFAAEAGSAGEKEIKVLEIEEYTAVADQAAALLEVASGTADACVIDITMANAMTGEGTSYAELGYKLELSTEEYGIAFRKDSDATAEVNKIMADLVADGTLKALADKYELTLA